MAAFHSVNYLCLQVEAFWASQSPGELRAILPICSDALRVIWSFAYPGKLQAILARRVMSNFALIVQAS